MRKDIFAHKKDEIGRKNVPITHMKKGGEIKTLKPGDRIKDKYGYELEVYQVEDNKVHVQAPSGATFTYYQKDFDSGEVETFWSNKSYNKGGRVSPSASATAYPVGTVMRSDNDGKFWIIKADKNGRQSWRRTDPPPAKIEEATPDDSKKKATPAKEKPKKPSKAKEKLERKKAIREIDSAKADLAFVYNKFKTDIAKKEVRRQADELNTLKAAIQKNDFDVKKAIQQYFDVGQETPTTIGIATRDPKMLENFTKTAEFKQWFGDWENISRADSSGQVSEIRSGSEEIPLLVWHGTTGPFAFNRFDMNRFPVMYFTNDKQYAQWFANLGSGIIYPAFLDIRWLFDLRHLGYEDITWDELRSEAEKKGVELPKKHPKIPASAKLPAWGWLRHDAPHNTFTKAVKNGGYTGMAHVENNPNHQDESGNQRIADAFMIFRPEQVKVPTEKGTASSYMDIFYMQKGGVTKAKRSVADKLKKLRTK